MAVYVLEYSNGLWIAEGDNRCAEHRWGYAVSQHLRYNFHTLENAQRSMQDLLSISGADPRFWTSHTIIIDEHMIQPECTPELWAALHDSKDGWALARCDKGVWYHVPEESADAFASLGAIICRVRR